MRKMWACFCVYPKGMSQKQISKRVNGMAVMLYILGLSYGAVEIVLNSLGMGIGKTRVYRAVQSVAERVPGMKREKLLGEYKTVENIMRFPEVTGSNLLRPKITLPDDLQGELKILFFAFQQWHQAWVDSWVPLARQLEQSFPSVQFYETSIIQKMNTILQTFINEGMRAGIPNQTTREKTITLCIDKKALRRSLEIPNEDTIWVLVLNRQENVFWRTGGAYSRRPRLNG